MFLLFLRKSLTASFAAALLLCSAFAVGAQDSQTVSHEHIDEVLSSINRGHFLGQVAVSPDGKRLAWIQDAKRRARRFAWLRSRRTGQKRARHGGRQG